MLEQDDPTTGAKKVTFSPVWLKWFVDLTALLSGAGGGGNNGALGDVVGPAVAVADHVALFDGATGKLLKDGGAPVNFVDAETPVGVVDGANKTFTLANTPSPATSLFVFHKTGRLIYINGVDYTLAGAVITTTAAPAVGDVLYANYRY